MMMRPHDPWKDEWRRQVLNIHEHPIISLRQAVEFTSGS